jgi:hypothetical protein
MEVRNRIAYIRKEHQQLLHLTHTIDTALKSFPRDIRNRERGLANLRVLEHPFAGVVEHCHAEDRLVESTFHRYLKSTALTRLNEEHQKILRALAEFRQELRFATVDRTNTMIAPGLDLIRQLRAHVTYEKQLLAEIRATSDKPAKSKGTAGRRKAPPRRSTSVPKVSVCNTPAVAFDLM